MGDADVQRALTKLVRVLDETRIPYAIIGAMALNEYGYQRVTTDVDVLLTRDGLEALKARALGHGYVEKFPGRRGLRDTENGVPIDVVLAGEYPGDGRPKPVRFPDPARVAVRGARIVLLPLNVLVELKLASGMSAPHRLRDLADVLELIRSARLPAELADELDLSVRDKYRELWQAAQTEDIEGWEPPDAAGAAFDLLADRGAITQRVADAMRAATGLRNRIAHGYVRVEHRSIYDEAPEGLAAMREFLSAAANAAGL